MDAQRILTRYRERQLALRREALNHADTPRLFEILEEIGYPVAPVDVEAAEAAVLHVYQPIDIERARRWPRLGRVEWIMPGALGWIGRAWLDFQIREVARELEALGKDARTHLYRTPGQTHFGVVEWPSQCGVFAAAFSHRPCLEEVVAWR